MKICQVGIESFHGDDDDEVDCHFSQNCERP